MECWAKLGLGWEGVGACSLVNCSSSLFCCEGGKHVGEGKNSPVKDYISAMSQPQRNLKFNLFILCWATSYYWCSQNPWAYRGSLHWRLTWYYDRDYFGILLLILLPLQPLQPISRSRVMRFSQAPSQVLVSVPKWFRKRLSSGSLEIVTILCHWATSTQKIM